MFVPNVVSRLRLRNTAIAATTIAVTALSVTLVQSEETYQLRDSYAVGDVFQEESTVDTNFTINASTSNEKLPPMPFRTRERQRHRTDVLAVTANNKIDGFRRTYTIDQAHETMPDSKPKTTVTTLHGKTVAVRRKNGKPVVTVAKGKISENDRKALMQSIEIAQMDFFPSQRVAVGAEWKVPTKGLSKIFSGASTASATGKLVEFVTYDNHRCARVKVTLNLSGKLPGTPVTMAMKLSGDLYQSMDIQRPLSFVAEGPITISGEENSPEGKIKMQGTGTMKMQTVYNWTKVAGKAITVEPIVVQ